MKNKKRKHRLRKNKLQCELNLLKSKIVLDIVKKYIDYMFKFSICKLALCYLKGKELSTL